MGLSVEQLLQEAKRCLDTDQPRMAALYMKKALELLKKEKAKRALAWVLALLARVRECIVGAWNALAEVVAPVIDAFNGLVEAFQSDFALVAEK